MNAVEGLTDADADTDALGEADLLGLIEGLADVVGDVLADGEAEADGDCEPLGDGVGDTDALGLTAPGAVSSTNACWQERVSRYFLISRFLLPFLNAQRIP